MFIDHHTCILFVYRCVCVSLFLHVMSTSESLLPRVTVLTLRLRAPRTRKLCSSLKDKHCQAIISFATYTLHTFVRPFVPFTPNKTIRGLAVCKTYE